METNIRMERAIENNDYNEVNSILEAGHFCQEYYLILASRRCSLELFKLIEERSINAEFLYERCLSGAFRYSNVDVSKYLLEGEKASNYMSWNIISEIESHEILDIIDQKKYTFWQSLISLPASKGNLSFLIWYRKKYSWPDVSVPSGHYHIIKYEHDNKLGSYTNACSEDCIYCNMNRMEIIWDHYREQGNYVDWLSKDIIELIEKDLVKRKKSAVLPGYAGLTGYRGEIGYTGSVGIIGFTGPRGYPG